MGGDRTVQLPARTRRRPDRRGAGHRQHRGTQGRQRHAVGRSPAGRLHPRCRPAAGRVQLPERLRARHGAALVHHPHTAGITFTGSVRWARQIMRTWRAARIRAHASPRWAARTPASSPPRADLDRAAAGIVRSAYGMGGQKCSALSRLYVRREHRRRTHRTPAAQIAAIRIGDPRASRALAGTGRHAVAYDNYARYAEDLRASRRAPDQRRRPAGGQRGDRRSLAATTCEPTLAEAPLAHPLWRQEMFLPILMLHRCRRSRRGDATGERLTARTHRRLLRQRAMKSPGSTTTSRPASPTPTVRRAPPPVRGLATSPSAAGRVRAAPARPSARSITCRNTCASSRRPWSSERGMPLLRPADAIAPSRARRAKRGARGLHASDPLCRRSRDHPPARRRLHLIRMTPDLIYDQMIGMGCAARSPSPGAAIPASARCIACAMPSRRPVATAARDHWTSTATRRWPSPSRPGASGLPCGTHAPLCRHRPARACNPSIRSITCPFTGESLAAVPAINPDVTILHAQRVDRAGQRRSSRAFSAQPVKAALAARTLLVTVEEQVEQLAAGHECDRAAALDRHRGRALSRAARIRPTRRATTTRDNSFYRRWDTIAREREDFRAWMERHVAAHAAISRAFLAGLKQADA